MSSFLNRKPSSRFSPGGLMRGSTRRLIAVGIAVAVGVTAGPTPVHAHAPEAYVKVGYFTQWGIYGRAFTVSDLHTSGAASRLTHVDYAFSDVTAAGVCASAD